MTDTQTIHTFAPGTDTPQFTRTETVEVPRTPEEASRRAILADWGEQRGGLMAAWNAMQANRGAIIAANTAVQQATTTAQVVAAIKQYAQANLVTLGTVEDMSQATLGALAVMERAMAWLDHALADMVGE